VPAAGGTRDYATTIVRNFFYAALMVLVWERLAQSADAELAAIAAKCLKEVRYHLHHARDWLVRLGDGTDESHRRVQAAVDTCCPSPPSSGPPARWMRRPRSPASTCPPCAPRGSAPSTRRCRGHAQRPPAVDGYVPQGKQGVHSEHLSYLLAEMQSLARAHPGAVW
jgi:ring-1,2-phenylacetyl-CoA epoxidase subunit PaaC